MPALPPWWKVRRETRRLLAKIADLPERFTARRRQRAYDRTKRLRVTDGAVPRMDEAAIWLLYPLDGVPRSTLEGLEHLGAHGIAPTVVSNLSLTGRDRDAVLERCHRLIERPNRGYDFGGYRDGALDLLAREPRPRRLFMLNDSIWFPLSDASTLIEDARRDPSDLFGIYLNVREETPHRTHLQSYFYRFGPALCDGPLLEEFWRDFITYDSKDLTVRRCEMRLTHWFASRGHSIGHLFDIGDLRRATAALEGADRTALLDYLIAVGDKRAGHLRALRAREAERDDALWRAEAMGGRLGRFALATHPAVLFERMGFPVLKRDRQPMYVEQRRIAAEDRYARHFSPTVRAEIAARR